MKSGFLELMRIWHPVPTLRSARTRGFTWGQISAQPQQPNQVHVSDPSLECWITAALQKEGLSINHKAEAGSVPRGEAGNVLIRHRTYGVIHGAVWASE